MISSVRSFGAPVIEPGGKAARTQSIASALSRRRPRTTVTIWWTVACDSTTISRGTSTVPSRETRPRSLRTRSAIMRFSARVFSSRRSSAARQASSNGSASRAAVPFIGRDSTCRSRSTRRNRSGEELSTDSSPSRSSAANGAGLRARSAR